MRSAWGMERALTGTATPVFCRGREIGERRSYDSRLLIAAIAALDRSARGLG